MKKLLKEAKANVKRLEEEKPDWEVAEQAYIPKFQELFGANQDGSISNEESDKGC